MGRPARRGWFVDRRFTEGPAAKVGLGLLSGGVFGASNVAVQVVAYLDHLDLDRGTFVGVIGVSAGGRIRAHVPESHQTGGTVVLLSVIAARLTLGGLGVL